MEIIIFPLVLAAILSFLGCALYGFIALVAKIFGLGKRAAEPGTEATYRSAASVPESAGELHATCRQLVRMLRRGDLDQETYDRLRDQLDRAYRQLNIDSIPPRLELDTPDPSGLVEPTRADPPTRFASDPPATPLADLPPAAAPRTPSSAAAKPPVLRSSLDEPLSPAVDASQNQSRSPFDFEDEPPVPQLDPRRPLAEVLSGFMLEKNIRWGELVGGMLIVGCAVGLVISLQTQLKALQDYFPYLVPLLFMLVTAAIHGAGIYTLRKWNLHTTSRGVLTIGLLLIPLNFLAATALAEQEGAGIGLAIAALAVGATSFGLLAYFSCHALFGKIWWMPATAILVGSLSMVLINRSLSDATPNADWLAQALIGLPLAGFLVGNGLLAQRFARRTNELARDAEQLLLTLGLSVFTLAAAGALWLSKFTTWSQPLDGLSLPGALVAAMFLVVGLVLQRRAEEVDHERALRVTGTAVAVLGGSLSGAALVLAWPRPEMLVAVALVNTLTLSTASFRAALPPHQIGAATNLGILAVVLTHWISGSFDQGGVRLDVDLLLASRTSLALSGAMVLIAVCGAAVPRLTARRIAFQRQVLFACCGTLAALSVLVAVVAGWRSFQTGATTDLHIASGILFAYSLAGLMAGAASANRLVLRVAAVLFWMALAHALVFNLPLQGKFLPWIEGDWTAFLAALLSHGSCCSLAALAVWIARRRLIAGPVRHWQTVTARELSWAGLVSAGLAAPLAVWQHYASYGLLAGELLIAAAVWLVGTLVHRARYAFAVFQGLLFGATVFLVASQLVAPETGEVWHQVDFWQAQMLAVAISCGVWNLIRLWCPVDSGLGSLLTGKRPALDLAVLAALAIVLLIAATGAVIPGLVSEFAPTQPTTGVQLPLLDLSTTWGACETWLGDLGTALWLPLGALLLATLLRLLTGHHRQAMDELLLIGLSAAVLAVVPFAGDRATASALRWSVSSYGLLVALVLWRRRQLETVWQRLRRVFKPAAIADNLPPLSGSFTWTALGLTILPLLALLTIVAARAIQKLPLGGPSAESLFHKDVMLLEINYGVPLALMVSTLLSHAIQRRESYYAFCGSMITMYLVGTGFVLFAISNDPDLMVRLIGVIQIATIFATVYGMLWLALHSKITGDAEQLPVEDRRLFFHIMIPGVMALFLAGAGLFFVTLYPNPPGDGNLDQIKITQNLGSPLGYVSLASVIALYVWYFRPRLADYAVWLAVAGALATLGTIAAGIHSHSTTPWLAYRVMMMGMLVSAALTIILPWALRDRSAAQTKRGARRANGVGAAALGSWAFFLACYSLTSLPGWSMATLVGLLILTSLLVFRLGPLLAYLGQVWILAGVVFVLIGWGPSIRSLSAVMETLHGGVIATILYAAFWMVLEVHGQSGNRFLPATRGPLYHRVAAVGLLLLFLPAFGLEFAVQLFAGQTVLDGPLVENPTGWLTALVGGGLLLGLLWDRESRIRLWPLFLWGLLMSGLPALAVWDGERLWPACGLAMGVYLATCGWLWRNQHALARSGRSLGIADAESVLLGASGWFVNIQAILTVLITLAQLIPVWGFDDRSDRFLAALVPFCGCLGVAATASATPRRNSLPMLALVLFSVFGVFAGWADLGAGIGGMIWLKRLVRLLIVTAFFTFLYGFLLPRWYAFSPRWLTALRHMTQVVSVTAISSLFGVLLLELAFSAALTATEAGAVGALLVLMIVGLVATALVPAHDPLKLSERGRQGYIYGAQAVAALLVLHLRLTFPELFNLGLFQYWPYLLMGIAFAGCGLAEIFQRSQLTVLSDPLGNTGFLISLVPAALIWFDGQQQAEPAVVLLTIGALHLITGVIRGSLVLGFSSIVFGNLALWTFYGNYPDWQFERHPQIWLIPPALSVLVAIQLNRTLLRPAQVSFARYACVAVIYVSSTSDIYLAGIGRDLITPMALTVLSVAGVLTGIAMRVQIYLYLGSSFLFVSLLSMVMVAHQQTGVWVWWVFGICMGIGILTLFAVFEKKRPELLAWIERIRNWEG